MGWWCGLGLGLIEGRGERERERERGGEIRGGGGSQARHVSTQLWLG